MGLLFTYGLTYGGAFVSLFNPFIGLLIYICFAILRPEQLWFFSVPQGNYSRIVAVALLIGWLFRGFGSWKFGRATPVVMSLIALMAWTTLSAGMIAGNQTPAWTYVEILAKIVLPFLVGITLIDSLSQLKQLAWVILLSEGFLAFEFNLWFFAGDNRLRDEGFGGMDNNCNAIALVTCLGLAGFLFFGCRLWWQKAIALGAAGFMAHAVMFTFSRGGMLAMIITAGVAFYLIPKRPAHILWLIAALLVMWRLAGDEVVERFFTAFERERLDESAEHRLELWRGCIQTMQDHPLGVGPANWGDVVVRFGFPRGKHAHTLWLQLGAELGLPGLCLLVTFYGLCIWRIWPMSRENSIVPDPWFRDLARMVIAALIGFAVAAQFVSLELLEHPFYITLIGAGLLKLSSVDPPPAGYRKELTPVLGRNRP